MTENEGSNLADLGQALVAPRTVIVLAGPGATAAAWPRPGTCTTVGSPSASCWPAGPLAPVTAQQASIVTRMGILIRQDPAPADLVIDALIGYGLRGNPQRRIAELIGWAGIGHGPVLALDGPGGLDLATSATFLKACI
jgi:NAD(P)H-hydrate repair Nnr-like enzyme with NAD(P)H-hydrate epimerase domain